MIIDKINSVKNGRKINSSKKPAGDTSAFASMLAENSTSEAANAINLASNIDILTALQEAEGTEPKYEKAKKAKKIIEDFDKIKLEILAGKLDLGKLEHINAMVVEELKNCRDPHLLEALREIETRIKVEKAKYEV